jgi:hypothetical protein
MLLYPFTYAGTQNASMQYVGEWQSPDFHDYFYFVFAASFMLLLVKPSRRRIDWALALPVLVLLAMSLQSLRVIPFYAIAVAPLLAHRLTGDRTPASPAGEEGQTSRPPTRSPGRRSPATPLNWLLLAASLAILASTLFLSERAQLGPEPLTTRYPKAGVEYLKGTGSSEGLFNLYRWGGYIIWSFYPERVVFVDGRADMYGDAFVADYVKVRDVLPGWEDVLARHGVETALVEKEGRMATLLHASPAWEEVFQGPIESVFRRVPRVDAQGSGAATR